MKTSEEQINQNIIMDAQTQTTEIPDTVYFLGSPITVDVVHCARCGHDHLNVRFNPLTNATVCTHYGWCAETGQPILLTQFGEQLVVTCPVHDVQCCD